MNELDLIRRFRDHEAPEFGDEPHRDAERRLMEAISEEPTPSAGRRRRWLREPLKSRRLIGVVVIALAIPAGYAVANGGDGKQQVIELDHPETNNSVPAPLSDSEPDEVERGEEQRVIELDHPETNNSVPAPLSDSEPDEVERGDPEGVIELTPEASDSAPGPSDGLGD